MTSPSSDSQYHFRAYMAMFALVVLVIIGCADFGSGPAPLGDDGGNGGGDTSTVLFATHILPIFQANCGGAFCHSPCGSNNGHGLCLASHSTLMAADVLIPGDAQNSQIVMRLDGRENPRMPYGRLPLSDSLIQLIRMWIDEGALNN